VVLGVTVPALEQERTMLEARTRVFGAISAVLQDGSVVISEETVLIGDGSVLDSMRLVELCLALEDIGAQMGFDFDWTSDAAMSRSRSMFRTAGSLLAEFLAQKNARS